MASLSQAIPEDFMRMVKLQLTPAPACRYGLDDSHFDHLW
jgi:hypothetical protein